MPRDYRPTFEYKAGDLRPTVQHIVRDRDSEVIDLTNGQDVRFYMKYPDEDTPRVNASMDILDTATGEVEYQ